MRFVLPDSLHLKSVYRACDYYRRRVDYNARRELLVAASILFCAGLGVRAIADQVGGNSSDVVDFEIAVFGSAIGSFIIFVLRRIERMATGLNLGFAIQFWQRQEVDHAFLMLFDEPRLLSPIHLRDPAVRRLLRDVLQAALLRTNVVEARTSPAVVRLLAAYD